MPSGFSLPVPLRLDEIASYHQDVEKALRLYFSPPAPDFTLRFAGSTAKEVEQELESRLNESDVRSTFAVLASLEAGFRMDFDIRCKKRLKDDLSSSSGQFKRGSGVQRAWMRISSRGGNGICQLRRG